jgi:hypothetical protein
MKHLKGGQLRGEGPVKQAARADQRMRQMKGIFHRPEVVWWDNESGANGALTVGLLAGPGGEAADYARALGLPHRVGATDVVYEWSQPIVPAAWPRQDVFFARPDANDNAVPINEPYTTDADVLALRTYQDPMHGGIEIFAESRHRALLRGATLGAIVYDAETGTPLLLSAAHVIANGAFSGNSLPVETVGHPIYQPRYPDLAGNLLRWGTNNDPDDLNVDAAVATIAAGRTVDATDYGAYGPIPRAPVVVPNVGDSVYKIGRTTGLTSGTVQATSASVVVGTVQYADLIRTGSLGRTGDSGSIVYTVNGSNPVGIFMGDDGNSAFMVKAALIEEDLGVTFMPPPDTGRVYGPAAQMM